MKLVWGMFLTLVIFSGFTFFDSSKVFAQSGLVVAIDSDIIWTKADSPHELTGPLLVSQGATLTIEAGATVNLNGYSIRVEGCLQAIGTAVDPIQFINGTGIEFVSGSTEWDEQTGLGCVIEHAILSGMGIHSEAPIKVNSNTVSYSIFVVNSSLVSNNKIGYQLFADSFNTILNNTVEGYAVFNTSNLVNNNNINGTVEAGRSTILSNNIIGGEVFVGDSSEIVNNTIHEHVEANKSIISNNTLKFGINGESLQISNNKIYGSELIPAPPFGYYSIPPIEVTGSSVISYNSIYGKSETSSIIIKSGHSLIRGNTIFDAKTGIIVKTEATIQENTITDNNIGIELRGSNATVEANLITENHEKGIAVNEGAALIKNNTISNNRQGISCDTAASLTTIEINLITNNTQTGVDASSPAIIKNNTFSNNYRAITINEIEASKLEISYNNIENCSQYSIYLRTKNSFEAKNNWWGTIDAQAINLTIYDAKYSFELGTVSFTPFLTETNPKATPNSNPIIPEFSSLLVCPLLLGAALLVAVYKRKISKQKSFLDNLKTPEIRQFTWEKKFRVD